MNRPALTPSRASDALLAIILVLSVTAALPFDPVATIALAILTTGLVVWPFGILVWLARRWARVGDLRFVALAGLLVVVAAGSTTIAILLSSG